MSPKKRPSALIVVAHPDDEAIFFAGLMLSKKYSWTVVCTTDGNADGMGTYRKAQFRRSCKLLGASKVIFLDFPDVFKKRLNTEKLIKTLQKLPPPQKVFTHGIIGEYGHPHHQDVSYSVHKAFLASTSVWSVSYNTFPELVVKLTEKQFKIKTKILWEIYHKEIRRFLNFLPATSTEGFQRVPLAEIEAIYKHFSKKTRLNISALNKYKWLIPYITSGGGTLSLRPF